MTNCYPPEIGAAANQFYELANDLKNKGHEVVVVTRFPRHIPRELWPENSGGLFIEEIREGVRVIRVNIPQLSRKIPLFRELEHVLNIVCLAVAAARAGRTDVTLVYSPPIVVGYAAVLVRLITGSRVVMNVQDLFPQSLIDLGLMKNRLFIRAARFLEKLIYRLVDRITVMSESNKTIVEKTAGDPDKVTVVYNWVDTEFIKPEDKHNEFREKLGLDDKFVLTFAGCIAESQDMEIIFNCAKLLTAEDKIVFLLAGNGPKHAETEAKWRELGLKNVIMIPIQPRDKYVKLLAASDVGLLTLNASVATPVVPSKMLSIMSAGRPILASLPLSGDAPKFIERAGSGLVVKAGETAAFRDAVLKLFRDRALGESCGRRGREWVVNHYSLAVCSKKYEELFAQVAGRDK
ncbi:MAG: glycosyltransferase family 4 protein [Candidatus Margulisiibacteriota bacterium]